MTTTNRDDQARVRLTELASQLSPAQLAQLTQFAEFLHTQPEARAPEVHRPDWERDLVDLFSEARVVASADPTGMDAHIGLAAVGGEERAAIYAHPPVQGEAIVRYAIALPERLRSPVLHFAVGIRDGAAMAADNLVAFRVRANGWRVWSSQTNAARWQHFEVPLPVEPGNVMSLELATEALGEHRFTWAVWGTPMLVADLP